MECNSAFLAFRRDAVRFGLSDRRGAFYLLFILSFEMAFILYLQGMTLFRWVCPADIGRVMIQVALFIPLFVASCFIPYLNLVWLMLIGMFSYVVYVKWSTVWR